jgi:ketol-acid reductoisomerase
MASRTLSRAARSQLARQFSAPVAKRTFVSVVNAAARPAVARAAAPAQQFRGVKTVDFAGDKEQVYERSDWPREKLLVSSPMLMNRPIGGDPTAIWVFKRPRLTIS